MSGINSEIVALYIEGDGFSAKVAVVDGSFNFDMGGKTREPLMGSGGVLGATEANTAGTCSFDLAMIEGADQSDLNGLTNCTIRAQWSSGAEWLMKRAFSTAPATGTAGSGTASHAFAGDPWLTSKT